MIYSTSKSANFTRAPLIVVYTLFQFSSLSHNVVITATFVKRPKIKMLHTFFFQFAEYRTVSGVAGPLVILDKVKVCATVPLQIFNRLIW